MFLVVQMFVSNIGIENEAATSLPNSRLPAINITDVAAPANSFDSPYTEKNAALNATKKADTATM